MALSYNSKKRIRKSFGKIAEAGAMPNLIEVQKSSYEQFLQKDVKNGKRLEQGIEAVFKSVFPIKDFSEAPQGDAAGSPSPLAEAARRDLAIGRAIGGSPTAALRGRSLFNVTPVASAGRPGTPDRGVAAPQQAVHNLPGPGPACERRMTRRSYNASHSKLPTSTQAVPLKAVVLTR